MAETRQRGPHLPDTPDTSPNGELEDIRELLLAAERVRLNRLEDRLKNSVVDASSLSKVLPDAIRQRARQDHLLAASLAPVIDETLVQAVQRSPQRVADALSPVMGPAIRRAVATALQSMMQSLNQTLDHSVSLRGLRWRLEAWRTGKPFSEVVLLHTLKYRVEQVFLVHRSTGLLLRHVGQNPIAEGKEDLVASMFTAIKSAVQRFAKDSLGAQQDSGLQSFSMEDGLEVWIEQGPDAVLAAVVRGVPPRGLRTTFQNALEKIRVEFAQPLQDFRGDPTLFEYTTPHLQTCLQQESTGDPQEGAPRAHRLSPALIVLLLPLLLLGWWGMTSYLDRQRWNEFLERARHVPGLHITSVDRKGTHATVYGMRDPLATDPMILALQAGLPHDRLTFQLEPYLALAPELIERRATAALRPPDSVHFTAVQQNGTTVLAATGTAAHSWILNFRKQGPSIPGVSAVRDSDLRDGNLLRLEQLKREIEARTFDFAIGRADLDPDSEPIVQALRQAVLESDTLAHELGRSLRLGIAGQTTDEGPPALNRRLAAARAAVIARALNLGPLTSTRIVTTGQTTETSPDGAVSAPPSARRAFLQLTIANTAPSTAPSP